MKNQQTVKTLNNFLKGQFMGIHAYEQYIQKITDQETKQKFQRIQQELKDDAAKVAKRIQNLGGTPVHDEGLVGSIQGSIHNLMIPDQLDGIVEDAIKGENMGIHKTEELIDDELDEESLRLIKELLNKDREHIQMLQHLNL